MSALTRMLRRHGELWTMSASEKTLRDEYEDEEPITPVTTTFKAIRSEKTENETEERGELGQSRFEELQLLVDASLDIVEETVSETFRILSLPGPAGSPGNITVTPPDPAFAALVNDIDWRVHLKMLDFSGPQPPPFQKIIAKFDGGALPNRSWAWLAQSNGGHTMIVASGASQPQFSFFNQVPAALNDTYLWLRMTVELDNGAGFSEGKFYFSDTWDGFAADDDQGTWTLIQTLTNVVLASINDDPLSNITIGADTNDTGPRLAAGILEAQVRDGIDGKLIYNPIFSAQALGATSFPDAASGTTVTVTQVGSPQAEIVDEVQPTRTIVGDRELPITLTSPEGRTFSLIGVAKSGVPVGAKRLHLRSGGADAAVYF